LKYLNINGVNQKKIFVISFSVIAVAVKIVIRFYENYFYLELKTEIARF